MDGQNAPGKKSVLDAKDEMFKIVSDMQRREATAGAVYKFLARGDARGEALVRIGEEKAANAQALSKYTGKDGRASRLKVLCWRAVARVFGPSFVISRIEAGEAGSRFDFSTAVDRVPEATEICAKQEEHRAALLEITDREGLRGIGNVANCLYGAILVTLGALSGFCAAFSGISQVSSAALCAAVSAVLAGAATGYFSQRSAAGAQHPVRGAIVAGVFSAVAAALLVIPFFAIKGAWGALVCSMAIAVPMLAVVAFFAAVVRQEAFFTVFVEMLFMTLGDAVVAATLVGILKVWLKLNA